MSNTIAHLAVAKKILDKTPEFVQNQRAFYLGILAPDTITSKPEAGKEEKKRVHLRENIRDAEWLLCNHGTIRQKLLKKAEERGIVSSDREFITYSVQKIAEELRELSVVE